MTKWKNLDVYNLPYNDILKPGAYEWEYKDHAGKWRAVPKAWSPIRMIRSVIEEFEQHEYRIRKIDKDESSV